MVWGPMGALGIGAVTTSLEAFGFHHNPIGQARCRTETVDQSQVVRVSDLGLDGADGVRIDLEGQVTLQEDFEIATEIDSSSVGGFLRITGRGTLDGQPDRVFMNQQIDVVTADSLVASYSLAAQSPASVTAYIWNQGVFQGAVPGLPAQFQACFKAVEERKPKVRIRPTGSLSSADIKIKITFGIVQNPGGGTIFELGPGDYHLVFQAVNPGHVVTDYTSCDLTARLPEIYITEERILQGSVAAVETGSLAPAGRLQLRCVNPMRASQPFSISYSLAEAGPVRLNLFDPSGRSVATLFEGEQPAGPHTFSGCSAGPRRSLPAGAYLLRIESRDQVESRVMGRSGRGASRARCTWRRDRCRRDVRTGSAAHRGPSRRRA